ncbi:class I adenylate-forming enzyme family protein [Oceaniglobus roseus]|uniref:class I adenylate-forming enzyme family protein n=1 Tax=Oceaniglobus roseus TaxID=1737570 RepID=UPI000C7EDE7C|nr:class I adenylate-forming enzyme family protein [Kandeliimicrobium roseum]
MPIPSDPAAAPFNLTAHVLRHAARAPERIALEVLDPAAPETWSYGALEAAVLGTATGLLETGARPGDRVLMRLGNTVDFPIAYLACLAVDLVPVPTSSQLTALEITAIAAAVKPRLVLAAPGIALPEGDAPAMPLAALRALRGRPAAAFAMGDPDRPGYIVFTSGTSGRPRGVVHAHRAIFARLAMVEGWYGLTAADRLMHAGAFNWTYTLGTGLMDPWTAGATALIPGAGTGPSALAAMIAEKRATIFAAAPGVYRQLLRSGMKPTPHLRHGLSAGEKLPEATRAAWEAATGTQVFEAYGMSECSTFISASPTHPARPGTLGRAQPGRRVAILGPDGPLPPDTPGTIAVAAGDPGLMLGYLDDPVATAARFQDGWFLTGDTGTMDSDGHVTYLGRDDDIMNAGGYRVSPLEVEAALAAFTSIAEAAAAEVAVREDVTVIAAFYAAPDPVDETALAAHCAARLARYKCPRLFVRVDEIPKGANGKILRRALRQMFEAADADRQA